MFNFKKGGVSPPSQVSIVDRGTEAIAILNSISEDMGENDINIQIDRITALLPPGEPGNLTIVLSNLFPSRNENFTRELLAAYRLGASAQGGRKSLKKKRKTKRKSLKKKRKTKRKGRNKKGGSGFKNVIQSNLPDDVFKKLKEQKLTTLTSDDLNKIKDGYTQSRSFSKEQYVDSLLEGINPNDHIYSDLLDKMNTELSMNAGKRKTIRKSYK